MQSQPIVYHHSLENIQVVIGLPIWRVIHPADGWLFFDLGRTYHDSIPGLGGTEIPYDRGECQLRIKGDWMLFCDGKTVATRAVQSTETQASYFERMDELVTNFPIRAFTKADLETHELVLRDDHCAIRTTLGAQDCLSITYVELDAHGIPVAYHHFDR